MNALPHPIAWQAPRPLWRGTTPFSRAPQILRFASDDFMQQLLAILAEEPARISDRIVVPETWRDGGFAVDRTDARLTVPLPAPMRETRRARKLRSAVSSPPDIPASAVLKLYQPAQMRYYLIAGTLTCAIPGLPERVLAGGHESVHFVMRRILPGAPEDAASRPGAEFAFVRQGDDATWQKLASGTDLAPGEELLSLFPLKHRDEDGRMRTLWAGLVPCGRREDYMMKDVSYTPVALFDGQQEALHPSAPAPAPAASIEGRTIELRMQVVEPWKAMIRSAVRGAAMLQEPQHDVPGDKDPRDGFVSNNLQLQMQSWLILVDLAAWLESYLPKVWSRIASPAVSVSLSAAESEVLDLLGKMKADTLVDGFTSNSINLKTTRPMATSLKDALAKIIPFRTQFDSPPAGKSTTNYTAQNAADNADNRAAFAWPDFHFLLAGISSLSQAHGPYEQAKGAYLAETGATPPWDRPDNLQPGESADLVALHSPIASPNEAAVPLPDDADELDEFAAVIARALIPGDEASVPPAPHAVKLRQIMLKTSGDPGRFVMRMVYMNEDCGPLHPPVLSAPTVEFRLASFFDPDAPVRPVVVTLPADTSPAGLRRHGRGAAFVLSDLLCGQVQRAKGLGFVDLVRQVLPWPLHKDIDVGDGRGCKGATGLEFGTICSLSIPIITLCALILLIIIVSLLDFIFRWMPWFIVCFPLPKFKGKSP